MTDNELETGLCNLTDLIMATQFKRHIGCTLEVFANRICEEVISEPQDDDLMIL